MQEYKRILGEFQKENPEADVEDEEFVDEYEYLSNHNQRVMEISCEIIKFSLSKEMLAFICGDLCNYYQSLSQQKYSYLDQLYPLCFYTDMVMYSPDTLKEQFAQLSLQIDTDVLLKKKFDETDFTQTAYFNLGVVFANCPANIASSFMKKLYEEVSRKPKEDEEEMHDNAVACLFKYYYYHSKQHSEEDV